MFKVDFIGDTAIEWSVGGGIEKHRGYHPAFYVSANRNERLDMLKEYLSTLESVTRIERVERRLYWGRDPEPVLKVNVDDVGAITSIGRLVRKQSEVDAFRFYDMDFTPQFRYCLETDTSPVPEQRPSTVTIGLDEKSISDGSIEGITVDGRTFAGGTADILEAIEDRIDSKDPDILVCSSAEILALLHRLADRCGMDFNLGRMAGFEKLAGQSTYESYGRVGNSPARHNIPGRAIIDTSNSFFHNKTSLDGILYLVEQSWKPVQECAWASIGNVLTAIQLRHARDNGVIAQWNPWRPERFKTMRQLHESDRGGFIFSPRVGFHETVYECDFSSLYPNIICTRNISPETVRCDCHDTADVPGLGYSICEKRGYLPEVLQPLIDDRDKIKEEIRDAEDPDEIERLEDMSGAIKWILVSCFGYQGFSNAKFGRIECHEAINAYAREIMLDAKEVFEEHGWRVVHGIIDSIWVTPIEGEDQIPVQTLCKEITKNIGIRLEFEHQYDWIGFCPKRSSDAGALTRYFGSHEDGYKIRGIEARQHSTPAYVKKFQEETLELIDEHHSPEPVCQLLKRQIGRLERGSVDPEDLLIAQRVSKPLESYTQQNLNTAALKRAREHDFDVEPGETIRYIVSNNRSRSIDRVRLEYESLGRYDADYYAEQLVRAAESMLSPFGWDRTRIKNELSETSEAGLAAFME